MRAAIRVPKPSIVPPKPSPEDDLDGRRTKVRALKSFQVMKEARTIHHMESAFEVLEELTSHGWDHVYLVDDDGLPVGRVHAVDLLHMVSRKRVNRDLAWMHAIAARELVTQPPLSVRRDTPLLAAAALLLTHELQQIGVTDREGVLIGVISLDVVARHLPRFLA